MHPVVFILLVVAIVLFVMSFFVGPRYNLWVAAAVAAVIAVLLHLFVLGPGGMVR